MSGLESAGPTTLRGGLSVSTLLVLVAAVSVGLAMTRTLPDFLFLKEGHCIVIEFSASGTGSSYSFHEVGRASGDLSRSYALASRRRASYWLEHVPYWSGPSLVSLTFATLALGMRSPRSRRAARRPGRVVGIAVLLALVWKFQEVGMLLTTWCRSTAPIRTVSWISENAIKGPWAYFWLTLPGLVGFGVVVGWMAPGVRRSPAPDAVERLARAIGWAWIALALSIAAGALCLALDL